MSTPSVLSSCSSSIKDVEGTLPLDISVLEKDASITSASVQSIPEKRKRGLAFWLVFLAICVTVFLSALDLASVGTALPTIVRDLNGASSFAWIGSAYTLVSAAWLPLSGALANAFGRRAVLLTSLFFFALGSALCGEATSVSMMIAGRAVQGFGSGGIIGCTEIVVADLVPLRERGLFMGLTGLTWAFASAIGPPIGGVFSEKTSWRWLFRLNLPITFVAFVLVAVFLRLKTPSGSILSKLKRIDWLGNTLMVISTCAATVAMTRGGVETSWTSAQTLVPLVLGLAGIVAFFIIEASSISEPTVPFDLLSNWRSVSGYLTTFLHSIITTSVIYFMPTFFQACKGAAPIRGGVDLFALAFTIAPAAIVSGVSVVIFKRYLPQNYIGWSLIALGCGLVTRLRPETPTAEWVCFLLVLGIGLGFIYTSTKFPILAPISVTRNANAMALFAFSRTFAQTFGVTIGSAVLQNELQRRLPSDFLELFPDGLDIAFAAIPIIPDLQEPIRSQVQDAFALSLSMLWKVMLGVAGAGFLMLLLMREVALHSETDSNWDMTDERTPAGELPPARRSSDSLRCQDDDEKSMV